MALYVRAECPPHLQPHLHLPHFPTTPLSSTGHRCLAHQSFHLRDGLADADKDGATDDGVADVKLADAG